MSAHVCSKSLQLCLFAALWTVARQAPLSMGFSRQKYWSWLPCPLPGHLPDLGIEPSSLGLLCWQAGSLPLVPTGKPRIWVLWSICQQWGHLGSEKLSDFLGSQTAFFREVSNLEILLISVHHSVAGTAGIAIPLLRSLSQRRVN